MNNACQRGWQPF